MQDTAGEVLNPKHESNNKYAGKKGKRNFHRPFSMFQWT